MALHSFLAASLALALLPPLSAPTREEISVLRQDLRRIELELALIDQAPAAAVASNLARMEAHLHLVRAQLCQSCTPGALAPSVYDDVEASCGNNATVTSSLAPEQYEKVMRKRTQWMRDRLSHLSREKSPFERKRLAFQYYKRIRNFIREAAPLCRAT